MFIFYVISFFLKGAHNKARAGADAWLQMYAGYQAVAVLE